MISIQWSLETRAQKDNSLIEIESKLKEWNEVERLGFLLKETKKKVVYFEFQRQNILEYKEKYWRLKSISLWLAKEDENTKYFHHYVNHRKNSKSIWNKENDQGVEVKCFEDIANISISYFDKIFKEESQSSKHML